MANEIGYFEAILAIDATAGVAVNDNDYNSIQWFDTSVIAKSVLDSKVTELQAAYDAKAYSRNRKKAYLSVKEQLDLLYHDMTNNKGDKTGEWYKTVKAVKDANPKG